MALRQANIRAALADDAAQGEVFNVAVGDRTTLNDLFGAIKQALEFNGIKVIKAPVYREFRAGDVRHSQADVNKAKSLLGYVPSHAINQGIAAAMPWYINFMSK